MYKVASDRRQAALHHGKLADWVNGDEKQTAEQRLRQLREGVRILDARIKTTVGEERTALGQEKLALQNEITEFRKIHEMPRKKIDDLGDCFFQAARDILPNATYKLILAAARREYARQQAERTKAE